MTKGFKSTIGIGSGKTQEQKNGEVAIGIFNDLCRRYDSGNKCSALEKLITLCAKKIDRYETEGSLVISEGEKVRINTTIADYRNSDIIFTANEELGGVYPGACTFIGNTSHNKSQICENSNYKKTYFDSFLKDLRSSIVVNALSTAKEDQRMLQRSFERTRALENSDKIFRDASNTLQNVKALKNLCEIENRLAFEKRARDLGIREPFDFKLEVEAILSKKKISDSEKEKLILEAAQKSVARDFSAKMPEAPTGAITIKKDSAKNLDGKGSNDRSTRK